MVDDVRQAAPNLRAPVLALALLSITAGFCDGYGLVRFGVFVANQSGNLVYIGVGLVGEFSGWVLALVSLVGFAVGVIVSWVVARAARSRGWFIMYARLCTVIVLMIVWSVTMALVGEAADHRALSTILGAIAMGVLATSLTHVGGMQAQTTFQTGTLLHSAQGLMDWLANPAADGRAGRRVALIGLMTIACYVGGGAFGALFGAHLSALGLLVAVIPIVIALLIIRGHLSAFRDDQQQR